MGGIKKREAPAKFEPGFLKNMDRRTEAARLLRERYFDLADDLGGIETLSGIKAGLLEQFVFLEHTLSRFASDMAATEDPAVYAAIQGRWTQAVNAYSGIATKLGLEKVAKEIDLKAYVAGKIG
ncbi:hypothetical protein [Calycomorphotria hydatis]|uniref:Uncharacterized protein n=1 Tax=Calycomorphotria hydatis TaxID=2528027 RepID=A0A517TDB8_9PLAN|nr:hypothetical protein [Calycomorphotria hydatis]QDT66370.1 hypothetical protein V22_36360 [Calycomorphotria hydatis]